MGVGAEATESDARRQEGHMGRVQTLSRCPWAGRGCRRWPGGDAQLNEASAGGEVQGKKGEGKEGKEGGDRRGGERSEAEVFGEGRGDLQVLQKGQ